MDVISTPLDRAPRTARSRSAARASASSHPRSSRVSAPRPARRRQGLPRTSSPRLAPVPPAAVPLALGTPSFAPIDPDGEDDPPTTGWVPYPVFRHQVAAVLLCNRKRVTVSATRHRNRLRDPGRQERDGGQRNPPSRWAAGSRAPSRNAGRRTLVLVSLALPGLAVTASERKR